jgi:hypothetical protein
VYLISATINFSVTGTQGGQATSRQFASASSKIGFTDWIDGNSFSVKTQEPTRPDSL